MVRRVLGIAWYIFAALVVTAALALSLARLLAPQLGTYRTDLQDWASGELGERVTFRSLDAAWRGFGPVLRLRDVSLQDPHTGRPLLTAREVRIGVDLPGSLRARRLELSGVTVVGTHVALVRLPDGRVVLDGFESRPASSSPLAVLLAQPRLTLLDSGVRWQDRLEQRGPLSFTHVNVHLRNSGDRHQLTGDVSLPTTLGRHLRFAADIQGAATQTALWHGRVYLEGGALELGPWLAGRLPGKLAVSGIADLRLWGSLGNGRLQHLRGTVDGHDLALAGMTPPAAFVADKLAADLRWRRTDTGWRLDVENLTLRSGASAWPAGGFSVAVDDGGGGDRQVRAGFDYLDLKTLAAFLVNVPFLTPAQRLSLVEFAPRGTVRDLRLHLHERNGTMTGLAFHGQFKGLGWQPLGRIPGVAGLDGTANGDLDEGELHLGSGGLTLDAPRLFRAPLHLDRLDTRLFWRRYADRLRIETPLLAAANPDLTTRSRLLLDIPADGSHPMLDMETDFRNGDVAHTSRYLPAHIMPPPAVAWLDNALVGGHITSGAMLFHGRLGAFPFDHGQGAFEVRANVENAVLDYRQGWSRIDELAAELLFRGRSMTINAVSGKILNADIGNVQARIPDLQHPRLAVTGQAQGTLADMLSYLRDSPLGSSYRGALGDVQAAGDARLGLKLDIPLHRGEAPLRVDGTLGLQDDRLDLKDWQLAVSHLNGELNFTEQGISGHGLQAQLLDRPVQITVGTTGGAQPVNQVQFSGRLGLVDRLQALSPGLGDRLSGATDWRVTLSVPHADGAGQAARATVELASDLKGVTVRLPPPLGKQAATARPFMLRTTVSGRHAGPVALSYGDVLRAVLELEHSPQGMQLQRGELRFGTAPAQLPDGAGLRIAGSVPSVVLSDWSGLASGDQSGAAGLLTRTRQVDLHIGRLQALGQDYRDLRLNARHTAGAWDMALAGSGIAGGIHLPAKPSAADPVRLDLDHLRLAAGKAGVGSGSRGDSLDPGQVPPLDVTARQLFYGGTDLGRLELHTTAHKDGLQVDSLTLASEWLTASAKGSWDRAASGHQVSRFDIDFQGKDLGHLLSAFGYAGNVAGGPTKGTIRANWAGPPMAFALERLEGNLSLHIGEGRILNFEPGAGRVFGLLSLAALPRRLSLDFSDLFRKGFSFDNIDGTFTLIDGDAYTNDLTIDGPAARIDISGRTGLVERDYDQLITVMPKVRASLPLAGALAGGPGVGAALFLADKLFPGQMDELTRFARYQYTLTGSWDAPVLERLQKPAKSGGPAGQSPGAP